MACFDSQCSWYIQKHEHERRHDKINSEQWNVPHTNKSAMGKGKEKHWLAHTHTEIEEKTHDRSSLSTMTTMKILLFTYFSLQMFKLLLQLHWFYSLAYSECLCCMIRSNSASCQLPVLFSLSLLFPVSSSNSWFRSYFGYVLIFSHA